MNSAPELVQTDRAGNPLKPPNAISPETDADVLELLQRQNQVQRALLKLAKDCGIAFYRPHWFQHCFHASPARRRGLFAGNRFGKSQANGAETAAWMLGERPWYKVPFDILGVDHDELGRERKIVVKAHHPGGEDNLLVRQGIPSWPTKQLIVCTNWSKVDEIWTSRDSDRPGKIWQFLPKDFAKAYTNHEGVIDEIHGANGSLLKFMSVDAFKRNKLTAESSDWDRVGFDEPGPQALWKGSARGLVDRNGQGDFTLTSLEELWIYEYFNLDELGPDAPDVCRDRYSLRATIYDNPHLDDDAIARFEAELTDDEKSCRLHGIPLELSGLIYKEFKKDVHVLQTLPEGWRDWHLPDKRLVMYIRADTHPVTPHAVQFWVVGPAEIPILVHEIWQACDADTLAETINAYLKLAGCFVGDFKVEPAAWIKDPSNRTVSIAKVLAKHSLFPRPASKDLSNGILVVKSALKRQRVLFAPTCRRTLWEFVRYRYDPETGKPVDENDHMMECLYRLLIDSPRFFDPDQANYPVADEEFVTADLSPIQ